MTLDNIVSWGGLILSLIIGITGLIKGIAEHNKTKGDTYSSYQEALGHAQDNYDKLIARFDDLEKKNRDLSIHNCALIQQLVDNRIVPISLEQAKESARRLTN